jgi:hypothetical protein
VSSFDMACSTIWQQLAQGQRGTWRGLLPRCGGAGGG